MLNKYIPRTTLQHARIILHTTLVEGHGLLTQHSILRPRVIWILIFLKFLNDLRIVVGSHRFKDLELSWNLQNF